MRYLKVVIMSFYVCLPSAQYSTGYSEDLQYAVDQWMKGWVTDGQRDEWRDGGMGRHMDDGWMDGLR